jgi:thiol-disulfide isomerase/thioredoxin
VKLVYFRADGCGVCVAKSPVAEAIASAAELPLETHDFEAPDEQDAVERLRIRGVPTLALVDGERVRFRLVGAMITPETAEKLIEQARSTRG